MAFPAEGASARGRKARPFLPAEPALGARLRRGVQLTKATVKKLALPAGKTDGVFWDSSCRASGSGCKGRSARGLCSSGIWRGRHDEINVGNAAVLDVGEARRLGRRLLVDRQAPGTAKRQAQAAARAATRIGELVELFLAYTQPGSGRISTPRRR